jgi:hypothetical protein
MVAAIRRPFPLLFRPGRRLAGVARPFYEVHPLRRGDAIETHLGRSVREFNCVQNPPVSLGTNVSLECRFRFPSLDQHKGVIRLMFLIGIRKPCNQVVPPPGPEPIAMIPALWFRLSCCLILAAAGSVARGCEGTCPSRELATNGSGQPDMRDATTDAEFGSKWLANQTSTESKSAEPFSQSDSRVRRWRHHLVIEPLIALLRLNPAGPALVESLAVYCQPQAARRQPPHRGVDR